MGKNDPIYSLDTSENDYFVSFDWLFLHGKPCDERNDNSNMDILLAW